MIIGKGQKSVSKERVLTEILHRAFPIPMGLSVLDVGCGSGKLANHLSAQGAIYTGIDPHPQSDCGEAIIPACGSALPFDDQMFDGVIMNQSLHHISVPKMANAFDEASRVLRPDGRLLIIEPALHGPAFEILSVVDDETDIRIEARKSLQAALASRELSCREASNKFAQTSFRNFDEYLAELIAVNPGRAATALHFLQALRTKFELLAPCQDGFFVLTYNIDYWVLEPT